MFSKKYNFNVRFGDEETKNLDIIHALIPPVKSTSEILRRSLKLFSESLIKNIDKLSLSEEERSHAEKILAKHGC